LKIIGNFTSCFIHEQSINELAFLQTANEPIGFFRPALAFSGLFSCGRQTANEPLRQGEPRAGRLDTPLANLSAALRESHIAMARERMRRSQGEQPVVPASATEKRMRSMEEALSLVFEQYMARSDLEDVIPVVYRACKSLRNDLVGQGFCMKTFSLCRALASASVRTAVEGEMASHREDDKRRTETFERLQRTIAIQIGPQYFHHVVIPCNGCKRPSHDRLGSYPIRMSGPGGWMRGRWCSAVILPVDRGTFGAGYRQLRRSRTAPCRGKQLLRQRY